MLKVHARGLLLALPRAGVYGGQLPGSVVGGLREVVRPHGNSVCRNADGASRGRGFGEPGPDCRGSTRRIVVSLECPIHSNSEPSTRIAPEDAELRSRDGEGLAVRSRRMRAGMRPGMGYLLEVLRGHLQPQRLDDSEWSALLGLAEEENVLFWVADRLLAQEGVQTPDQRKRLDEIHRKAQLSTFVWTETLKGILQAFHGADVPVISLKGPCLAERLYGDAARRNCYDLDL